MVRSVLLVSTIDKQGLEGGMGFRANALKIIGKTDFEGGRIATCAHKRKTPNILKCKISGMLHAENNHQDYGATPTLDEDWSGMNPPMLSTNKKLTGATTNVL